MGRPAGWMQELTGRDVMRSPGAPSPSGGLFRSCVHLLMLAGAHGDTAARHLRNVTEVASLRRSSLHISNLERAQVMY
jgi:hypothetical protein